MIDRLLTSWIFFRISVEERLVYRGDFMLGTMMRFLPIVTQIFLWWAIFQAATGASATRIANYSFQDMVAYYLLAMVARAFSSMPGLTPGIARQIQNGEVKKYLIQPIDMLEALLLQRAAHKVVYYLIATLPFAFVFYLCRDYFSNGWPDWEVLIAFALSLVMGFLLGFYIEACMGLVGFWFLEVTSLAFIYMLVNFFLSGHMFPLEILPREPINFHALVNVLPLKYMAYFPAAIFLEKVERAELWAELGLQFLWLAFFYLLSRLLWLRGTRRYSAFGG